MKINQENKTKEIKFFFLAYNKVCKLYFLKKMN